MIQTSDDEPSRRSSTTKTDLRKLDLAAQIALAIEGFRLTFEEAAAGAGLERSQLRGITEDGHVAGFSKDIDMLVLRGKGPAEW